MQTRTKHNFDVRKVLKSEPKVKTIKYNFRTPKSKLKDDDWIVWEDQPLHARSKSFITQCIRKGHKVYAKVKNNKVNIAIKRIKE